MPTDRIKQLEQYYAEDPQDPFNAYALALEYMKTDPSRTKDLFDILLTAHADYLPTYYHAARFYHECGDNEKAVTIFENGIALAAKVNDTKALRELRSAYDEMMFE